MQSSNAEPVVDEAPEETVPAPLILLEPDDDAGVCTPDGMCD
jgi:hypothetical protein